MLLYRNQNDDIELFEDNFFQGQPNKDNLIEIAIAIVDRGYEGVLIHHRKLQNGELFIAVNYREDTIEGALFAEICDAFELQLKIPRPENVLRFIKLAYQSLESEA